MALQTQTTVNEALAEFTRNTQENRPHPDFEKAIANCKGLRKATATIDAISRGANHEQMKKALAAYEKECKAYRERLGKVIKKRGELSKPVLNAVGQMLGDFSLVSSACRTWISTAKSRVKQLEKMHKDKFVDDWKDAKSTFNSWTKKRRPGKKFLVVFNKSGIEPGLKRIDKAADALNYELVKVEATKFHKSYSTYIKKLQKAQREECKTDKQCDYDSAVRRLETDLTNIGNRITNWMDQAAKVLT